MRAKSECYCWRFGGNWMAGIDSYFPTSFWVFQYRPRPLYQSREAPNGCDDSSCLLKVQNRVVGCTRCRLVSLLNRTCSKEYLVAPKSGLFLCNDYNILNICHLSIILVLISLRLKHISHVKTLEFERLYKRRISKMFAEFCLFLSFSILNIWKTENVTSSLCLTIN